MAKTQTAVCIDSNGIERQYKQSWLDKQRALGKCSIGSDGVYHFRSQTQTNKGAGSMIGAHRARSIRFAVQLRPNEPTPVSNGDFLPYPFPSARAGAPLRLRYPTLARAGAGLG